MAEAEPPRTVRTIQQQLATSNGLQGNILWDLHQECEKDSFIQKMSALLPEESEDYSFINNDSSLSEVEKQKKKIEHLNSLIKRNEKTRQVREALIEQVWAQRKYYGGDLLMAVVFVALTPENPSVASAEYNTNFSLHPLIRVRKCTINDSSYSDCCIVFVDENSRVYQNWQDFLANNTLPQGVLVGPKNGVYSFDDNEQVILECVPTPACNLSQQIINTADVATGITGMIASAVPIAALFTPIGATAIATAGVVAAGSGIYSTGRSVYNLFDRNSHEQSISLSDRQARGSWFGAVGGVVAVAASGATQMMGRYAAAGNEVSSLVQTTVNGFNVTSIALSGGGVGNGVMEIILKYKDGEDITALDLAQLGASLILFTHSVYNFQYASNIIESSRSNRIDAFKNELSNRQKKMFNKMQKETIRIRGESQGKIDIIRGLNNIPDKQYFNDLYKINKQLNANKVRPSFAPDGTVLLNNEVSVDAGTLRQSVQHNVGENVLGRVRSGIPETFADSPRAVSLFAGLPFDQSTTLQICKGIAYTLRNCKTVQNEANLINCIAHLCENLEIDAVNYLIELARKFVEEFIHDVNRTLNRVLPFENVLYDLFELVIRMRNPRQITRHYLSVNATEIIERLKEYYRRMATRIQAERVKCSVCRGYYSITPLD